MVPVLEKLSKFLALEGNIRVLAVQTVLSQVGYGMFLVVWQPYILSTGATLTQLGLVQTVINITTGIGLILWGYISDHYGRKPVIVATLLCRVAAILSLMASSSLWALLAYGALMGFTAMFYIGNPARNALITESVEAAQRGTAMSTLITISQGISTLVATLGGYIAFKLGYTPIFILMVIGDTLGSLLCSKYLKETLVDPKNPGETPLMQRLRNSLAPEPQLIRLYTALLLLGFSYTVAYSLLYGALSKSFGFTTVQLGVLSTSFNLLWALGSIPLGKLVDRIGRKRGLLMSLTMALATSLGFLFSRGFRWFAFFNALSALDVGFWIPSYTSYITETVEHDKRSTVFGKLDAYSKATAIPGAWVAGVLYERYGFHAPLYVQIAVVLVVLVFMLGLKDPAHS